MLKTIMFAGSLVVAGFGLTSAVSAAPVSGATATMAGPSSTVETVQYGYGRRFYGPRRFYGARRFGPRFYGPRRFYGGGPRFYGRPYGYGYGRRFYGGY